MKEKESSFVVVLSNKNHPIFKAHFPNYPIMPGFLLIEIAIEVLRTTPKCIKSAKFIAHALPEDRLTYSFISKGNKTKIVVLNDTNKKLSEFTLHKDNRCT
ncbi:MAG: 3-hydroxyacyl-ACP dehydratase [Campylobacterales bacterium]